MAENSLVAEPEESIGAGPATNFGAASSKNAGDWFKKGGLNDATAGAGLLNDAASTATDAANHNWVGLGFDVAADALGLLGVVMEPLDSLARAGIGWLIEHISFLKEPLDALCGDPNAVSAHAVTWSTINEMLDKTAKEYAKSAKSVAPAWRGDSGSAYQKTAQNYTSILEAAASEAHSASTAMNIAGAIVGAERGIIRDLISEFVLDAIEWILGALATAWCTLGATAAICTAEITLKAASLASSTSERLTRVAENLSKIAKGFENSARGLEDTAKGLENASRSATRAADAAAKDADKLSQAADKARAAGNADKADSLDRAAQQAKAAESAKRSEHFENEWKAQSVSAKAQTAEGKAKNYENEAARTHAKADAKRAKADDLNSRGSARKAAGEEKLSQAKNDWKKVAEGKAPGKPAEQLHNARGRMKAADERWQQKTHQDKWIPEKVRNFQETTDDWREHPGPTLARDAAENAADSGKEQPERYEHTKEAYEQEHEGGAEGGGKSDESSGFMDPAVTSAHGPYPLGNTGHQHGKLY